MNGQIKIFVINLKRSIERRNEIKLLMHQYDLDHEIFEAVDGQELPEDFLRECRKKSDPWYHQDWGDKHSMKLGEIGVALSHAGVYTKIIDKGIEVALVLEDDINFDQSLQNFLSHRDRISKAMKKFDLILLGYCGHDNVFDNPALCSFWGRKKISSSFKVGIPLQWYWSAIGYLISKKGAQLLLKKQMHFPAVTADILTANSPQYGVHLGIVNRPIIWPGELNRYSTIHGDGKTLTDIGNLNSPARNENEKNGMQQYSHSIKSFISLQLLKAKTRHYTFTTDRY